MEKNTSPNENYFHDDEVMTVYLFGIQVRLHSVKEVHDYICSHFKDCFPKIPEYHAFNYRLNKCHKLFKALCDHLFENNDLSTDIKEVVQSIDSFPIVVSKKTRKMSDIKKDDLLNNGYCSSKKLYYYGGKGHIAIVNQEASLGKPIFFELAPASNHDLPVAKKLIHEFKKGTLIGDKAYISKQFKDNLLKNDVILVNPIKLSKNKKEYDETEKIYNRAVSSRRQSIEIFFAWLIQLTKIQKASFIRSVSGFLFFVYSRIAFMLLKLQHI